MTKVTKVKLGNIIDFLTDYHANGSYEILKKNVSLLDQPNYAVMIRTKNFEQDNFVDFKYINEHAYNFLSKSKVLPGDILMNKIATPGSVYLMPDLNRPVSLAMNLFLIRINNTIANSKFVFYYLKLNEAYIKSFASGSVTQTITKDAVRNLIVELPEREIQEKIVLIIESIEKRITLNKQMNTTLQRIVSTFFGELFKNDNNQWPEKRLREYIKTIGGYSYKSDNLKKSDNALITLKNFERNGGFRLDGFKEYVGPYKEEQLVETGDLVVAHTDVTQNADLIGNPILIINPFSYKHLIISTDCVKVSLVDKSLTNEYLYFLLRTQNFKNHCLERTNGTTVLHLDRSALGDFKFSVPPQNLILTFTEKARPIIQMMNRNTEESILLDKIKHIVVPKLINETFSLN